MHRDVLFILKCWKFIWNTKKIECMWIIIGIMCESHWNQTATEGRVSTLLCLPLLVLLGSLGPFLVFFLSHCHTVLVWTLSWPSRLKKELGHAIRHAIRLLGYWAIRLLAHLSLLYFYVLWLDQSILTSPATLCIIWLFLCIKSNLFSVPSYFNIFQQQLSSSCNFQRIIDKCETFWKPRTLHSAFKELSTLICFAQRCRSRL